MSPADPGMSPYIDMKTLKHLVSSLKRIASAFAASLRDGVYQVFAEIIDKLVHLKPLPEWTNGWLFVGMLGLWAFAIGISWWGDSMTYILGGLSILALWFAAIFIKVEYPTNG